MLLTVALYGCKLDTIHQGKIFENKALRKILAP